MKREREREKVSTRARDLRTTRAIVHIIVVITERKRKQKTRANSNLNTSRVQKRKREREKKETRVNVSSNSSNDGQHGLENQTRGKQKRTSFNLSTASNAARPLDVDPMLLLLMLLFRLLEDDDDDGCPNSLLNMIGTRARDNFFCVCDLRKMRNKKGCLLKNMRAAAGIEKQTDLWRKRAVRACFYGTLILRDKSTCRVVVVVVVVVVKIFYKNS
jgi:hypothetical protein